MRVIFGPLASLPRALLWSIFFGTTLFPASRAAALSDALGPVASLRLYVVDQVKDGCWTNAPRVKTLAEGLFRQSGIEVVDSPLDFFGDYPDFRKIVIRASGYRTTSGVCIGSLTIHSRIEPGWSPKGAGARSQAGSSSEEQIGNFLLSDKRNLNELIAKGVQKSLTEFMANAARARGNAQLKSAWGTRFLEKA